MTAESSFPNTYEGLVKLAQRLRGPGGCPWDRKQTHGSLKHLLLEECYELIEAIEQGNAEGLAEELGDVLFHVILQVQIAHEASEFSHEQVFQRLIEKLVRRHPHVFGGAQVADAGDVEVNWDSIKRKERTGASASALDGVPKQMPALLYAQEIQGRAARTGFDWEQFHGVLEKVAEEMEELGAAQSQAQQQEELGDLLFSVVNVARWLGLDAEGSLRQANARFRGRFASMEQLSRERGLSFADLPMGGKDALWLEAKGLEG